MIFASIGGSFDKTIGSLLRSKKLESDILEVLKLGGLEGVLALRKATPVKSGLTAQSWDFFVSAKKGVYSITWTNSDVENGFPVAVMLQYGYGTGTGGYVKGIDYINPALRPIFDKISEEVWKVVTSA